MDVNSLSFYLSWLVNFSSATEMLNEFAYGCHPVLRGYYIIIGMFTCISLKMKKTWMQKTSDTGICYRWEYRFILL